MRDLYWALVAFGVVLVFTQKRQWDCERCYQNFLRVGMSDPSWIDHQECKGCQDYVHQKLEARL